MREFKVAVTHHRGPWRSSCCPIWPPHCNDKRSGGDYVVPPSFFHLHLWLSLSHTLWRLHTVTPHGHQLRKRHRYYRERTGQRRVRLAWDSEHMDQQGRERVEKGERGEERRLEPGTEAKQTILNRAVLWQVPGPQHLPQTGLAILPCLWQ